MSRFRGSPACIGCGVIHGRDPRAVMCLDCKKARLVTRRKTAKYRAYQTRYNQSLGGKLRHYRYESQHPERIEKARELRRSRWVPTIATCASLLCGNTFIRPSRNRRTYCLECVRVFYGAAYARARLDAA